MIRVDHAHALVDPHLLGVRHIAIEDVRLDADRVDDERVALPLPARMPVEAGLRVLDGRGLLADVDAPAVLAPGVTGGVSRSQMPLKSGLSTFALESLPACACAPVATRAASAATVASEIERRTKRGVDT